MHDETRSPELARSEANLALARERVVLSMHALGEEVSRRSHLLREAVAWRKDWREWVRRRPGACVVTAFAVGYLIGQRH